MNPIPLMLNESHKQVFEERAISPEFALKDGYRTVADNEARQLGFETALPRDERKKGLQGIGIPFGSSSSGEEPHAWRLRPDNRIIIDGKPAKYLSRKGDRLRLFLPHTNQPGDKTDILVPLIITESELKATAIAENVVAKLPRRAAVVGLQGINGGWMRPKKSVEQATGKWEKEKYGPPELIPDLAEWEFAGRRVYLCFDSDIASPRHAEEFKRNNHSGPIGAEATLARLLHKRNAIVSIMELPDEPDGSKNGADDYLVRYGWERFVDRMRLAVAVRNIDTILDSRLVWQAARALDPQPPIIWTLDDIYRPGTLVFDVGDSGSFKTWAMLDRAVCVAMGIPWLGRETVKTNVLIIDQEADELYLRYRLGWAMRGHGAPKEIPIFCTTELYLNLASPKDQDRLRALIERFQAGLVLMDSWAMLTTGADENVTSEVAPIMNALKRVSRSFPSCLSTIHHTNKAGGVRGNISLKDYCDVMLICTRQPEDIIAWSTEPPLGKSRASRIDPFSAKANFNDDRGIFFLSSADPSSTVKLTPGECEVLEIISSLGNATREQIAGKVIKCSPNSVGTLLSNLGQKAKIKRVDDGSKGSTATYAIK